MIVLCSCLAQYLWGKIVTFQLPYLLEWKLHPNRDQYHLEAVGIPGYQVNRHQVLNEPRVPAVGIAVQRIFNITKGCGQTSMWSDPRRECLHVVATCKPAFSVFVSCGDVEKLCVENFLWEQPCTILMVIVCICFVRLIFIAAIDYEQ